MGVFVYIGRIRIEVKCKVKYEDINECSVKELHNRMEART